MFLSRLPTAATLAVAFLLAAGAGPSKLVSSVTPCSHQDFVANVGDRVFFETDSTDLTPTAAATLDQQAQWLNRYPHYTFILAGHAEERGTPGKGAILEAFKPGTEPPVAEPHPVSDGGLADFKAREALAPSRPSYFR